MDDCSVYRNTVREYRVNCDFLIHIAELNSYHKKLGWSYIFTVLSKSPSEANELLLLGVMTVWSSVDDIYVTSGPRTPF